MSLGFNEPFSCHITMRWVWWVESGMICGYWIGVYGVSIRGGDGLGEVSKRGRVST